MSGAVSRLSQITSQLSPAPRSKRRGEGLDQGVNRNFHTLTPAFWLPRAAQIEPDALAVWHISASGQELRYSYKDLADRARGFAYYVRKHDYKHIGILATNTPGFLEAFYGIAGAGSVSVAINYRLKKDDIKYMFEHSDCDAIMVDAEYKDLLSTYIEAHPSVRIIVDDDTNGLEGDFAQTIQEGLRFDEQNGSKGWNGLEISAADENALMSLSYTSGTTARPKGVEYTHRGSYTAAIAAIIECNLNLAEGRCKFLWTLPMFHATGWCFPWSMAAVRGTNYCMRKMDVPLSWKLMKEEGITHFNAAPTVNTMLLSHKDAVRLPQKVRVTVGASPPSAHLFQQMVSANLHPIHVFGMTETYGPFGRGYYLPAWETLPEKEKFDNMNRQGYGYVTNLPFRVIKVGDDIPEGTIIDVEKNSKEIGEVVFVGNMCAPAYYKDPEATRKLWAGGVLHSGDLAVWNPDGSIKVQDRAKDIIISGGENISSVSLEGMLLKHPDILEVAVVAVKDEKFGERPKAFVTLQAGKTTAGQDIILWAKHNSNISGFMVPREVEIVQDLPKTSTGKIRKNILREWAKGADRSVVN